MSEIKIDNLSIFNDEYNLTLSIKEKSLVPFFARDNKIISELFLKLSGINYSQNIYYNEKRIYDNPKFFKHRIYLCFKNYFVKTIFPANIKEGLRVKYKIDIDQDKLEEVIEELWIRSECDIKGECRFTPIGNTLINFALAYSIDRPIYIISNPTIHLEKESQINYVVDNLKMMSQNKTVIVGLNKISHFKDKLKNIIIFTDYNRVVNIDLNYINLSIISGDARGIHNIIKEELRLFYTYKNDMFQLIFINNLDRDEIKELSRLNCKIEKIKFFDIEKYM